MVLSLSDGHYWHPDIVRRGSAASVALLASLGAAEARGDEDDEDATGGSRSAAAAVLEEAHGWNYAVREEGVLNARTGSHRIRLARNSSSADLQRRYVAGREDDCTPPRGCAALLVTIPQLMRYATSADELLTFSLPGSTVWDGVLSGAGAADSGAAGGGGRSNNRPGAGGGGGRNSRHSNAATAAPSASPPSASASASPTAASTEGRAVFGGASASVIVQPPLHLRSTHPCSSQASCQACTGRAACGWCASDDVCRPRRDGGLLPGECSGLLVEACPHVTPPAVAGGGANGTAASSPGGGGGDEVDGGGYALHAPPPPGIGSASDDDGARWLRRVGVGILVLSVGDVDLKAGRFYADVQVYLHVETDHSGADRLYPPSALLDADRAQCGSMPHWRPFEPPAHATSAAEYGLFMVNIDRFNHIDPVWHTTPSAAAAGRVHHFRVQGAFYFRTNITAWPMNTESLDIVLETRDGLWADRSGSGGAEGSGGNGGNGGGNSGDHRQDILDPGLFFCTMPECASAALSKPGAASPPLARRRRRAQRACARFSDHAAGACMQVHGPLQLDPLPRLHRQPAALVQRQGGRALLAALSEAGAHVRGRGGRPPAVRSRRRRLLGLPRLHGRDLRVRGGRRLPRGV